MGVSYAREHAAVTAAESRPAPAARRGGRLTRSLWGIEWDALLPVPIGKAGITVEWSSFDRSLPFVEEHYGEIFETDVEDSGFQPGGMTEARERYYREAGDFFEFIEDHRTVGLLVGTPVDWSTYYLRSAATLPSHQGRKIIQRFFLVLFEELRAAGVERIQADTAPSNMATMQLLTRMRFNVTGTVLTDRWGAHVQLTRFLDEEAEEVFLRQYCSGVKYQRRGGALGRRRP